MAWKYNPFTDALDQTGSGGASYINGVVADPTALPVTLGTPALDSVYLAKAGSGVWLINRKPAGLYCRVANNGNLNDWVALGAFPEINADGNWELYNSADPTKELKFDLSGIATGTTRTLTVPDASGTLGWLQSVSSITVSSDHQLTAARNQRVRVNSTAGGSGGSVYLPSTGNAEGDRLEVACVGLTSGTLSVRTGPSDYTVSASIALNEQRTFIYTAGAWTVGTVESHSHSGLGPTFDSSTFRVTEPSGLSTNRLAFSLSGITAGATRTLTAPNANGTIARTEDFAAPPAIGSTTPSTGAFTTLNANNGTITASAPVLTLSQTWNNAAVTFTGLDYTITDTNSNAGSRLWDFKVGTTSVFAGRKTLGSPFSEVVCIQGPSRGFTFGNFGATALTSDAFFSLRWQFNLAGLARDAMFAWGTDVYALNYDLAIQRDAADTLAQRRSTNPQTFRLYNTFTSTTNFERLNIIAQSAASVIIGTEKGSGGGSARGLELRTDNVARITIGSAGQIGFFGATAAAQPTAVADATDAATVITQLNALLSRLRTIGIIAT